MTKGKKMSKKKKRRIIVNIVQTLALVYCGFVMLELLQDSLEGEKWKLTIIPLCFFGTIVIIDFIESVAKTLGFLKS